MNARIRPCAVIIGAVMAPIVGCGSSSAADDCQRIAAATCHGAFQCEPTQAALQYGNEAACESQMARDWSCATASCPAHTTYVGSQPANECVDALNLLSAPGDAEPYGACSINNPSPAQCGAFGWPTEFALNLTFATFVFGGPLCK